MKNTFSIPIIPKNEEARLRSLYSYQLLDTPFEDTFDDITNLVRDLFEVPIALITLVDKERVWFKSNVGMESHTETNRGSSLCSLAILDDNVTVFEDALKEPCLLKNPLVAGSFGLKFYAGAPLRSSNGFNVGSVCIIDKQARSFTKEQRLNLKRIASITMDKIEMRKQLLVLSSK